MVTCVLTVEALFVIGLGVCGASLVAQMVKTLPAVQETWV